MTAAIADAPSVEIPEGAAPIRLPVMVVEGMETADGRFIEPGALSARVMPIALYSQVRSSHGSLNGDTSTVLAGAITKATRRPGPEVMQLSTSQPFPEGTFVWEGEGWMYTDVPAKPDKSAYTLVKDKALRGNSVDLSEVDAQFEYGEDQDLQADPNPQRIIITSGVIGATTLVGQPAFPDAYIELEGTSMGLADQAVTASAVPAWRAAEVGDMCSPCAAIEGLHDDAITAALGDPDDMPDMPDMLGDDIDPDEITPRHTGGMVALIPSNPNMLRVPGGDPADELHLTLMYLGEDVTGWTPEDVAALLQIGRTTTDYEAMVQAEMADAERKGLDPDNMPIPERGNRPKWQEGALEASIFSHAIFNPNGDNGHDPATVYLLDGTGDRMAIESLHDAILWGVRDALGTAQLPEQHSPFVPHVTAGYGVPITELTYTGPVEFNRLRIALGDQIYDYPLGGPGALTAAATPLPPADVFERPKLDGPTPVTVGEMQPWGARAYGHIAEWGTCHIGFADRCVTPPRSVTDYAYFMVHSTRAEQGGEVVEIPVGYGTVGTGHASIRAGALAAAEHYDNTGTVAFEYTVGEDDYGIWFAGRLLPGLPDEVEHKARGAAFSGDWRTIRGNLEMIASLAVPVPGFPIPRARVASGSPVSIVAAGAVRPAEPPAGVDWPRGIDPAELQELIADYRQRKVKDDYTRGMAELGELTATVLPDQYFDVMADLLIATDGDHPWFHSGDLGESDGDEDFAKRQNWVAKAGGLPKYIKRIVKHLRAKGMDESRAIATAVNAAKKMCSTGDTSLPGQQQVNAGSRAEACTAVTEWEAKRKAGSK